MRKTKIFKSLLVGIVSILFIASLVSYVYADDDIWGGPEEETQTQSGSAGTGASGTGSSTGTSTGAGTTGSQQSSDDVVTPTEEIDVPANNNTSTGFRTELNEYENADVNTNNNTTSQMPHTGIEDNSLLFVVITLGLIVAGYSYKKLSDYNNL